MTCRELIDFIMDYLAGELDEETRREFARHLEGCAACRDYLASFKATVRIGKGLALPADPAGDAGAPKAGARSEAERDALPEELVQVILAAAEAG